MLGRISSCSPDGIHSTIIANALLVSKLIQGLLVRTDFFDDIFVEREELPEGCV